MSSSSGGLSFVRNGHHWSPERSGDYSQDCETGRAAAREMLSHIRLTENPLIYGSVVRDMVSAGQYGGVEIGFCSEIGIFIAHP